MRTLLLACSVMLWACGKDGEDEGSGSETLGDAEFGCGSMLQCRAADEYCEVVLGPDMLPLSYHCVELPMECPATPECECLEESTCGMCEVSPEGGLTSRCAPE